VYGSFLLHANQGAERYGVDTKAILLELGERKVVGGQEDIIIDVAVELQPPRTPGLSPGSPDPYPCLG
jgi:4-hydroxy 2-oxovalerate aldolase